jgi:hypothetical protein
MPDKNEAARHRVADSERFFQDSERPIHYEQLKDLSLLPVNLQFTQEINTQNFKEFIGHEEEVEIVSKSNSTYKEETDRTIKDKLNLLNQSNISNTHSQKNGNEAKHRTGQLGAIKPAPHTLTDHSELDQSSIIEGNMLLGALSNQHQYVHEAERESSSYSWIKLKET